MLKPVLDLIRSQKFYSILFIFVVGIYSYAAWMSRGHEVALADSDALKRFEQAEESFQSKLKNPQKIAQFMKDNPRLGFAMEAGAVIALAAFIFGIVILRQFFMRSSFREKLIVAAAPDSMRWNIAILFKVILLFLFTSFIYTLILGAIRRWLLPGLSNHFYILTHSMISNFTCVFLMVYFSAKQGGSIQSLGLRLPSKSFLREVLAGWMGYLAIIPIFSIVMILISIASDALGMQADPHALVYMFLDEAGSKPLLLYSLVTGVVVAPILEEIFFRGFMYSIIKHYLGKEVGMVLTASIFAAIHGSLFAFWPIFVLGLTLNYLYETRQSLWTPIVMHVTHNAVFIGIFFLAKKAILHSQGAS